MVYTSQVRFDKSVIGIATKSEKSRTQLLESLFNAVLFDDSGDALQRFFAAETMWGISDAESTILLVGEPQSGQSGHPSKRAYTGRSCSLLGRLLDGIDEAPAIVIDDMVMRSDEKEEEKEKHSRSKNPDTNTTRQFFAKGRVSFRMMQQSVPHQQ